MSVKFCVSNNFEKRSYFLGYAIPTFSEFYYLLNLERDPETHAALDRVAIEICLLNT